MRVRQLDILRAVAVLLVMVRHLRQVKSTPGLNDAFDRLMAAPQDSAHWPTVLAEAVFRAGWVGVDLFFVLSGFLVSGLLFREFQKHGSLRIGRFLLRRGLKIYPPFYAFLLATLIGSAVVAHRHYGWAQILCETFFVQNYGPNIWGHTWSLAVEEHFYLLLALLFYVLTRRKTATPFTALKTCFVVVATVELGLRLLVSWWRPEFDFKTHIFATHLRLDALFYGVILSYLWHLEPARLKPWSRARILLPIALVLLLPPFFLSQHAFVMRTVGLTGLSIGFSCLLLWALTMADGPAFLRPAGRALGWVGLHSYSIYLWHLPVLVFVVPLVAKKIAHRPLGWAGELLVYVVGSIAVGVLTAKAVELPVLRLRDRLFPSQAVP